MQLKQVTVQLPSENGYFEDVWWIDSRFAKKGQRVVDEHGVVWTVHDVHASSESTDVHRQGETNREFQRTLEKKTKR